MAKLIVELEKTRAELNAAKTEVESLGAELNSALRKAEKTITDAREELKGLKAMLELEKDKAAKATEAVEEVQATADRLATEFGSEEGNTVVIRSRQERLKENLLYRQMSIKKAERDARVELNALKVELELKKNEVFEAINEKKIAESRLDVAKNLLYMAQKDRLKTEFHKLSSMPEMAEKDAGVADIDDGLKFTGEINHGQGHRNGQLGLPTLHMFQNAADVSYDSGHQDAQLGRVLLFNSTADMKSNNKH